MAAQEKLVAAGDEVAPDRPTTMFRVVAGEVTAPRRVAADQPVAPTVTMLVAVTVMGTETTSPLQSEVSNALWKMLAPLGPNCLLEVPVVAMLRALLDARLNMLSNALSTLRALL